MGHTSSHKNKQNCALPKWRNWLYQNAQANAKTDSAKIGQNPEEN